MFKPFANGETFLGLWGVGPSRKGPELLRPQFTKMATQKVHTDPKSQKQWLPGSIPGLFSQLQRIPSLPWKFKKRFYEPRKCLHVSVFLQEAASLTARLLQLLSVLAWASWYR